MKQLSWCGLYQEAVPKPMTSPLCPPGMWSGIITPRGNWAKPSQGTAGWVLYTQRELRGHVGGRSRWQGALGPSGAQETMCCAVLDSRARSSPDAERDTWHTVGTLLIKWQGTE